MVTPRTVFALLALLLTATHCVDIDDRDLDVRDGDDDGTGGGSSTTCEPDADDTNCTLCTKDYCCGELTSCNDNADCVYFADCWFNCVDDVCEDACADQYPNGVIDFADFIDCTYQQCLDVCS